MVKAGDASATEMPSPQDDSAAAVSTLATRSCRALRDSLVLGGDVDRESLDFREFSVQLANLALSPDR